MTVHNHYNPQNHPTFHSEDRFFKLRKKTRVLFWSISLLVYASTSVLYLAAIFTLSLADNYQKCFCCIRIYDVIVETHARVTFQSISAQLFLCLVLMIYISRTSILTSILKILVKVDCVFSYIGSEM